MKPSSPIHRVAEEEAHLRHFFLSRAYKGYSELYLSITFTMAYAMNFACLMSTVVHTMCDLRFSSELSQTLADLGYCLSSVYYRKIVSRALVFLSRLSL